MSGYRSITPSINVNTPSGQLRTELFNAFVRLDGQLTQAPYRLASQNGPVGNEAGTETDLMTFQLNFNTLTEIGQSLQIIGGGKTAANANNKRFRIKLGTTTIFDSGTVTWNDKDFQFYCELVANGATSQIVTTQFIGDGQNPIVRTDTYSEDFGTTLDVTFTGEGTSASDISLYYYKAVLLR